MTEKVEKIKEEKQGKLAGEEAGGKETGEELAGSEKQIKFLVVIMAVLLLGIFIVYFITANSKTFTYGGLDFQKINFDKLIMYYSKIPQKSITGDVVRNYNLYLEKDPRTLNNIPVQGKIALKFDTIVSTDPAIDHCSGGAGAGMKLSEFFLAAGIKSVSALMNESYALEKRKSYVPTCNESLPYTILLVRPGSESKIVQMSQNCYSLEIKDCQTLEVIERFIVAAIAHSKDIEV